MELVERQHLLIAIESTEEDIKTIEIGILTFDKEETLNSVIYRGLGVGIDPKAKSGKPFAKDEIIKKDIDYESDMYSGEGSVPGTDPRKRLCGDATNDASWSGTCTETDTHSAEGSVPGTDPSKNRYGPDTKDARGTGKFVVKHRQPDSEVDSMPKEDTVHIDKSNLKMDKCTEKVNISDPEQNNDTDLDVQGTDSNNATRSNRSRDEKDKEPGKSDSLRVPDTAPTDARDIPIKEKNKD